MFVTDTASRFVMALAIPVYTLLVPSVTINAGILHFVRIIPLTAPNTIPTPSPTSTATIIGTL